VNVATCHSASFRDPSGFVFTRDGKILRQVNPVYRRHYEQLMHSGLYQQLTQNNWLITHEALSDEVHDEDVFQIIAPKPIEFISYPYEWCFSQLKDAALRTLEIQKLALQFNMSLKDASAYNIQYVQGKPLFIDTLSFECYEEGEPWAGYRQFCQHFLAPLALMALKDIRLLQLLKVYIDGIPLELASTLLPKSSWLNPGLLMHLHLHAKMEKSFGKTKAGQTSTARKTKLSKAGFLGIIDSLQRTIHKLTWEPVGTEWAEYYQATNYTDFSFSEKARIVQDYLQRIAPKTVWDLGANTGHFSRLAQQTGAECTLAFDIDPAAVEMHYRLGKQQAAPLPLLLDLTNPTPGLGWHHNERDSLLARGPADCVMALALMHHLAISNTIPFRQLAAFFKDLCQHLIIEFVPKSDSQVQRLLHSRKDIFPHYDKESFEKAFSLYFDIQCAQAVEGSERILYLMKRSKP
jgi:hypothetical protein